MSLIKKAFSFALFYRATWTKKSA